MLSNLASAAEEQAAKTSSLRCPAVAYAHAIIDTLCLSSFSFLHGNTLS